MRAMGFNRRKMEDQRRQAAEKESAARRATDAQILEDAERLIAAWNERQEKRMPTLFSPSRLLLAEVVAGLGQFPDRVIGTLPESRMRGALLPPRRNGPAMRGRRWRVQLTSAAAPMIER
jgi:hypothetical protein